MVNIDFEYCFSDLNIEWRSTGDVFVIKHPDRPGSYLFFAPYEKAISNKYEFRNQLGDLLNEEFSGDEWNWHHVVPTAHLKRLYSPGDVATLKYSLIPTLLVERDHLLYNTITTPTANVIWGLPDSNKILEGAERQQYLKNKLPGLYKNVYGSNAVLLKVAENTLKQLK